MLSVLRARLPSLGPWALSPYDDIVYNVYMPEPTDAAQPATKGDLSRTDAKLDATDAKVDALTTKLAATDAKVDRLAIELVRTRADLAQLWEESKGFATKADIERVLSAIDAFARKGEAYDRKSYSHGDMLQNHEAQLRDHGRRIGALEAQK